MNPQRTAWNWKLRMSKKHPRKLNRTKKEIADVFRSATVELGGIEKDNSSIPLILVTEKPFKSFDLSRFDVVDEIVKVDGMTLPNQVPLIDSHDQTTVTRVFGSIRDLKKENGKIIGRAYFASDATSQQVFRNYIDGHLTDVSVGARREEVEWDGKTKIVTRSRLMEGSVVVAGMDPEAKMMPALRACTDPYKMKEEKMEQLLALLIERGMPAETEGEKVFDWIVQNLDRSREKDPDKTDRNSDKSLYDLALQVKADLAGKTKDGSMPEEDIKRAAAESIERIEQIDLLCRKNEVEEEQKWKWIKEGLAVDAVARKILDGKNVKDEPIGSADRIDSGKAQREKFYEAARCGLIQRCASSLKPAQALENAKRSGDHDAIQRSQEMVDLFEKPADGHQQFRHVKLNDLARMFLEESGERDLHRMPINKIVRRALAIDNFITRASDGPAYNTTGSFANLMLDAANKTLLSAYDEAMVTYPMWTRQAPSASDFKNLNRIRFGELSDPEVVPENAEYPEKQTSDSRENYVVQKYGEMFSISFEAIVNDDLNAISRIPAMQGNAMRRKVNKVVYAELTANNTLSDGIALFHATSHGANLDTTTFDVGGAVAAINTGWNVMATQSGLNSDTILNIQPRFLIVPAALAATALTFTHSIGDPTTAVASTEDAARPGFSASVGNIYGPNGPRQLVVVADGVLDGTSTTGWYLAADPSQVDTIELTFLQGEESPVLSREEGFTTDTMKYKIRQTFAAKAIDFRGLYQGNT